MFKWFAGIALGDTWISPIDFLVCETLLFSLWFSCVHDEAMMSLLSAICGQ
jgi:hypothetical protein